MTKQIKDLAQAGLDGSELVPVSKAGVAMQTTVQQLALPGSVAPSFVGTVQNDSASGGSSIVKRNGLVTITANFDIGSAPVTTQGWPLINLPAGYRPDRNYLVPCVVYQPGVGALYSNGGVIVYPNGSVALFFPSALVASSHIHFNITYPVGS